MVSKTQPAIPPAIQLETIFEESGSSLSSTVVNIHRQPRNRQHSSTYRSNQTIHGLISARSIPSVDVHRQRRANECQEKPPIEVRYRDGSTRYIHPSSSTAMIMNRRKYSHSSRHDSSSSSKTGTTYVSIFNTIPKKKKTLPKKHDIILTVITADELSQAGITPPSTSSPDESETSTLTNSPSNSSKDTKATVRDTSLKDPDEVPLERLPMATVLPSIHTLQPVIDNSLSNIRFPIAPRHNSQHHEQLRHPQQLATIRSQSLPPSQSHLPPAAQHKSLTNQIPPVAVVPPSPKISVPSLQITLTNDENERNLSSKANLSNTTTMSSSKSANETRNSEYIRSTRPGILLGGGSRSAFRPFLKQTTLNAQPQMPFNINVRPQISLSQTIQNIPQQQQQIIPPSHYQSQQYQPMSASSMTHFTLQQPASTVKYPSIYDRRSISLDAPKQLINPIISNQILSDNMMKSTSHIRTSNYQQPQPPQQQHQQQSAPTINTVDKSFIKPNVPKDQAPGPQNHSVSIDPSLQWHSVTSKSLYDLPRLSHQYSNLPLRITLPVGTPTHNQKLVVKHDTALEKRLLNAGLSPETIALYERILEVADIRQISVRSPPTIHDQYQHQSFL